MEEKSNTSPICTTQSYMMSPGMQCSYKAIQLFQWRWSLPPSRHAASPIVTQQDQCVTGTVRKGGRKGEGGQLLRVLPGPWRGDLDRKRIF